MSQQAPPPDDKPRWLDHSKNVDRVFHVLVGICAVLLLIDLVHPKHAHFDFEGKFGFYSLFGFLAYVGLITCAKGLRRLIKRDEDYYD